MSNPTIHEHTWGQWEENEAITAEKMNVIENNITALNNVLTKGVIEEWMLEGEEGFTRQQNKAMTEISNNTPTYSNSSEHDIWEIKLSLLQKYNITSFFWYDIADRHQDIYTYMIQTENEQQEKVIKESSKTTTKLDLTRFSELDKDTTKIYLSMGKAASRSEYDKLYYNQSSVRPFVSINEITGGHKVILKDFYGTNSFNVMDGYSPTITTTKSDGVTTLIIHNKDGGEIVQILDGATGETPHMTVMKDGDTNTITFMTMQETISFDVKDGAPGAPGLRGLKGDKGDSYVLTSTDKQEIADLVDDISLLQLKLDNYPLSTLPELTIYQDKKCYSYNTETFVPAAFQDESGQDIYVFNVKTLIDNGITKIYWKDALSQGCIGQSWIIWKEGIYATNTAATTITDTIRTVNLSALDPSKVEYMLITFKQGEEWLRFEKDYSEETIDRTVKGWLRPDDLDESSRKVLTEVPETITSLENQVEQRGYNFPITLVSGTYLNSTYNGVRSSEATVTINNVQYPKYWWSGWIDVRGVDTLVLNTITGSASGYGFRKGNTCITYPGEPAVLKEYTVKVPDDVESFAFSVCLYNQTTEIAEKVSNNNFADIINLRAIPTGEFLNKHADAILQSAAGYPPYEMLLSGKTLCIGDSLTVGSKPSGKSGIGGRATPYYTRLAAIGSFPDTIESESVSGISPSEWYRSFAQIKDFTAYNNYLIWLGTNRGPTTEPAAKMADETVGTETYYYRKIIEDIIAANANAKIFLCSVFASKDSVPIVNDCIRQIAALYPANVMGVTNFDDGTLFGEAHIDLHYVPDGTEIDGAMNNGTEKNPHFNEGGYFVVATKWLSEIRRLIRENIVKF